MARPSTPRPARRKATTATRLSVRCSVVIRRANAPGAARLDGVGVDRPLAQHPLVVAQPEPRKLLFLDGEEGVADDRALALRIRHAGPAPEEVRAAIGHVDGLAAVLVDEVLDGLAVALPHEARVHVEAEHAAGAEGAIAAVEGHGGIDAAA